MQRRVVGGLSANKQLTTEATLPISQQPSFAGLSVRKPLSTATTEPTVQPMGAPIQQRISSTIHVRKPLNTEPLTLPSHSPTPPSETIELAKILTSNIIKPRTIRPRHQLVTEEQSQTVRVQSQTNEEQTIQALPITQPQELQLSAFLLPKESVHSTEDTLNEDRIDFDHFSSIFNDVPYVSDKSIWPTEVIENELKSLEEVYRAGFILRPQYLLRRHELEEMKKRTFTTFVPNVDYSVVGSAAGASRVRSLDSSSGSIRSNRNVRVFVSSTFRDMAEEREVLLKNALPELQRFCRERGVFLTAVDLRWGITSEQANQGNTIYICLSEVDRCRPYFIALLGQRYGWSHARPSSQLNAPLDESRDEMLKKCLDRAAQSFPWIEKYRDRSVTELEIRHAALNDINSDTAQRSLIYLKKPSSSSGVKDDDVRLTALKEELKNSPLRTKHYQTATELSQQFIRDFKEIIDKDFPLATVPGPLQRERMAHVAFQESRARVYIGRKHYFERINSHFSKPGATPLVVVAESGLGKSALMANWIIQHQESAPDRLVIASYIGSTPASTDLGRMLHRIISEIQDYWKLSRDVPQDTAKLIESFPEWLNEAEAHGGCTILFDAINQLEGKDDLHSLCWLPHKFPPNVYILISTTPGPYLKTLQSRNWPILEVEPLTTEERKTLIEEYLAQYGKRLTPQQLQRIVDCGPCKNPLFLRTLLEELRLFGSFEQLDSRIDYYLRAKDSPHLFQLVFQRLEEDTTSTFKSGTILDSLNLTLVGKVLGLIWVARRGLLEMELLDVLKLSHSQWSPLYMALEEALVSRSGFFTFFHDYMRQAVETRYLKKNNNSQKFRSILIDYFQKSNLPDDHRLYEEVPWQMEQSNSWSALCEFITTLNHFEKLYTTEYKFDLYRYWRSCINQGKLNPSQQLMDNINKFESQASANDISSRKKVNDLWIKAAKFFEDIGTYEPAEILYKKALQFTEETTAKASPELCSKLESLAYLLRLRGRYNEALPLYQRALKIRETITGDHDPLFAQTVNSLAILYRLMGRYNEAEPLYLRALEMRKRIFGEVHEDIAQSYNSLGCLCQDMGRYKESEEYFLKAINQRETLLGVNHPDVAMSLNNLAGLYIDWSKYDEAKPIYERALRIYEMVFGPNHPHYAQTLNSLAGLAQEQGRYDEAKQLYERTIEIKEKLLGPMHPELALTFNDLAVLYARQDRYSEAEIFYKRALNIRKTVLGEKHPDYAQSLKNLGALYQDQGRYDEARSLYEQCLQIFENAFGKKHMDVASALHQLGALHQLQGLYNEALPYYNRSLEIYLELLGPVHADVALSLNDLAILYFKQGNYAKAEEHYHRSLETYQKVFGPQHPDVGQSLLNIAQFYKATRQTAKAKQFFEKAISVFSQTLGSNHPRTLAAIASSQEMSK